VVPEFTGRIVEWDFAKGCGWLESDGQRIFLHWREFAERRKRPAVGDVIRFTAGSGPTGRICAQNAVHLNHGGRFSFGAGLLFLALLVFPVLAIAKLRIPEATLHFLELIGGWPGAFVAQRRLRHKCSKRSYQAVFWLVVGIYQYLAFGLLRGWELPKAILRAIRDIWR